MIVDSKTEACRQCTLKHLSTAMVTLTDDDIPEILKKVYFCGHLSHAANHFVHINEELAENIRVVRLDAQNDRLEFTLHRDVLQTRLTRLIQSISEYEIPAEKTAEAAAEIPPPPAAKKPVEKRGCPCKNKK